MAVAVAILNDAPPALRHSEPGSAAADELFALLYDELHTTAESILRGNGGALTLQATVLVHEAYLRIAARADLAFPDRGHFFAYVGRAMRTLVIDYARRRRAVKRGHTLENAAVADRVVPEIAIATADELVQLGDALDDLASLEPAFAEIVDMHFFGGFSFAEIAEYQGVSQRTVERQWQKARLLLRRAMVGESVPRSMHSVDAAPGSR